MNFCSDNTTAASPEIIAHLMEVNGGHAMPYGEDEVTTYPLADFHIVLYKSRDNKVYEFKLYTETDTLKLRHFDQLHDLFIEICRVVEHRKKARWWQFL